MEQKTEFAAPGITAQKLAEYIKEQTGKTWEETTVMILKLSIAQLEHAEKLRELGPLPGDKDIPMPMHLLITTVLELGWGFMIKKTNDGKDELNGLIVGSPDYIENISKQIK